MLNGLIQHRWVSMNKTLLEYLLRTINIRIEFSALDLSTSLLERQTRITRIQ